MSLNLNSKGPLSYATLDPLFKTPISKTLPNESISKIPSDEFCSWNPSYFSISLELLDGAVLEYGFWTETFPAAYLQGLALPPMKDGMFIATNVYGLPLIRIY